MALTRTLIVAALLCVAPGCDDRDDGNETPAPSGTTASIRVENFTATATPASGAISYRIAFTLRETAGTGATLSDVTLTAQTSAGSIARTFTAVQSFGTNRITANGTLAASVTFEGPPVAASQLSVRIPFTDDSGNSGTVQGTTNVTTGS